MSKHSREFDRSAGGGGSASVPPPIVEPRIIDATDVDATSVEIGTVPAESASVDPFAMDRTDPSYLNPPYASPPYANPAYARSEQLDPYAYRELGLLESLYGAPRRVAVDTGLQTWAKALRRFARAAVWALPLGSICIALGAAGGWPTATSPTGGDPGIWLILTVVGLILAVLGVVGLAGLMAATPGGPWAAGAVVGMIAGSLLLAPVLALVALVRPAGPRLADGVGATLEAQVLQATTARWFGVGGLVLLAAGGLALGCAVLATRILNRTDGWLILVAVALAVTAAYVGWQFLLVMAGMALLAASLGLAWTTSRLTPDGILKDA